MKGHDDGRGSRPLATRWVLAVALAIGVLPLLLLSPFPTQDGPVHLYGARLLPVLGDAAYPLINQYFEPSQFSGATRTGQRLLALLLAIAGAQHAEALLLLIAQLGLFAVLALPERGRSAVAFPLAALPFVAYNLTVGMGFYSFCLSLPVAVLMLRLWVRARPAASLAAFVVLVGCCIVLPLLHPITAALTLLAMGLVTATALCVSRPAARPWREIVVLALLGIPTAALALSFPKDGGDFPTLWASPAVRVAQLLLGACFAHLGRFALITGALGSIGLLALGCLAVRERTATDGLASPRLQRELTLLSVSLLAALLVPDEALAGAYFGARQSLLFFLVLLLFLRGWSLPRRVDLSLTIGFCLLSSVSVVDHYLGLRPVAQAVREIAASAEHLDEHATVLFAAPDDPLESDGRAASNPLRHAGDLLGLAGDRVVLTFYEGGWRRFPVNFRESMTPFGRLFSVAAFESSSNGVFWDKLTTWNGPVDYVALWDEAAVVRGMNAPARFVAGFCANYREVYRSKDWPWAIYRYTATPSPSSPPICTVAGLGRRG